MCDVAWGQLVNAALVGTDRRAYVPVVATGALGELLARIDGEAGGRALLQAAAVLACYRRAGREPMVLGPSASVGLGTDLQREFEADLPWCPGLALPYLMRMLAGEMIQLLPEWLMRLADRGERVPDRLLPELLDLGCGRRELRGAIGPVLGARGRWLAAQRSDWGYAVMTGVVDPADSLWETGDRTERRRYLEALRRQDADRARERLAETLGQDSAADRALFVGLLEEHLTGADLPFLESLLGDRSKVVQQVAIGLLVRLPESSICRGAIEWLRPLLVVERRGDSVVAVDVRSVPIEKGLRRLDLEVSQTKRYGEFGGEFGTALVSMVAAIPLGAWPVAFGVEVLELVGASRGSDWAEAIAVGLTMAVVRAGDGAIAAGMIRFCLKQQEMTLALFGLLPMEERLAYLQWLIDRDRGLFWLVVTRCPYRWDGETTDWTTGQVCQVLVSSKGDWTIVNWLADGMVSSVAEEAIDRVLLMLESPGWLERVEGHSYVRQGVEKSCQGLRFRREAIGALRGD